MKQNTSNRCFYLEICQVDVFVLEGKTSTWWIKLTLFLLTWTKWRAPTNASKWRMGFNSAFKGLNMDMLSQYVAVHGAAHDVCVTSCCVICSPVIAKSSLALLGNFFHRSNAGVHKFRTSCLPGQINLYRGAKYLWFLSIELLLFHPPGA